MSVFTDPYTCNTPVFTQPIGPFSSNTSLTVTATLAAAQVLTVSGTATDCNNQPLLYGTAIIYTNPYNYQYTTVVNGNYSASITHCDPVTDVTVIVVDNSNGNQQSSGLITVSGNSVTIPLVNACGTNQPAIFTFSNSQGACQTGPYVGTYTVGVPFNNNTVTVMVNVTAIGTYTILGSAFNGFSFHAYGTFTTTGVQPVVLTGGGQPIDPGTFTFYTSANGMTGCSFPITVSGSQGSPAVIELGAPASCPNIFVNGSYSAGVPLNSTNTATVTLNVVSPGSYYIVTNNTNGFFFSDSGTVTTTGMVTFVLSGSGTPMGGGFNTYQLQSNGVQGCIFGITTQAATNAAAFTFEGAPGTCASATSTGNYVAGTQLTAQNTVTLPVIVTTAGTYAINTNFTNGMSFAAQGIFSAPGIQTVTLTATGTPVSAGLYTFIPQAGNINGCVFTVLVN
jgi:hypothetical protein